MYKILYSKSAAKQIPVIKSAHLEVKVKKLISILEKNPYQNPPQYEKLVGDLDGLYSRRINIKHRLVYQVFEKERFVRINSMWTHYEN